MTFSLIWKNWVLAIGLQRIGPDVKYCWSYFSECQKLWTGIGFFRAEAGGRQAQACPKSLTCWSFALLNQFSLSADKSWFMFARFCCTKSFCSQIADQLFYLLKSDPPILSKRRERVQIFKLLTTAWIDCLSRVITRRPILFFELIAEHIQLVVMNQKTTTFIP